MIFLQLVLQNDFGSFCWKSVFCMSHQRQHDCSSVILAAQLKNAATQGSFRCNVRSREEHEFKLRAKLFSNSCCESPIHSYTLLCILYFFFFFYETSMGVLHLEHLQSKHYLCCEDQRGETFLKCDPLQYN